MLLIVGLSMGSNPSGSFDSMRKFILIVDLAFIIWFVALQFYRFKETGRACSGDFLIEDHVSGEDQRIANEMGDQHERYGDLFLLREG